MKPVIALLSDFGTYDAYVGILKGVILKINPRVRFVDITHEILPQNLLSATYLLYSCWDYFPGGTIFLAVIDPGVGSQRKEIIAIIEDKYFVGPDNGIISLLLRFKKQIEAYSINNKALAALIGSQKSSTFHGRDIFAPAAAFLSCGKLKNIIEKKIKPCIINDIYSKKNQNKREITGKIVHIDRFGNCISSIHKDDIKDLFLHNCIELKEVQVTIREIKQYYSEVASGAPLAYWGSSGFLEIGIREGNAAQVLGIKQLADVSFT